MEFGKPRKSACEPGWPNKTAPDTLVVWHTSVVSTQVEVYDSSMCESKHGTRAGQVPGNTVSNLFNCVVTTSFVQSMAQQQDASANFFCYVCVLRGSKLRESEVPQLVGLFCFAQQETEATANQKLYMILGGLRMLKRFREEDRPARHCLKTLRKGSFAQSVGFNAS